MKKTGLILAIGITLFSSNIFAEPKSFYSAKKILAKKIYTNKDSTFYCGCDMYYANKKGKPWLTPSHDACGFEPRKQKKRASRIEWEHVMPAWYFGHQRQCWQNGGRSNCKNDKQFEKMEADLHNLVPAIGEVNGDRSNFSLTMVTSNISPQYGQCEMKIDFKNRKAEPKEEIRGDIARIYFYMAETYNLKLSRQDQQMYTAWNNLDPVSENEVRIHNLKAKEQGRNNPYVTGEKTPEDFKNGSISNLSINKTDINNALSDFSNTIDGGDKMVEKLKSSFNQKLKDFNF